MKHISRVRLSLLVLCAVSMVVLATRNMPVHGSQASGFARQAQRQGAPTSANAAITNYKLSGDMPDFGGVSTGAGSSFNISPDGQTVVFVADGQADELFELYSVPIDGSSAPVYLFGPVIDLYSSNFQITSDSSRVVIMTENGAGQFELFTVPIGGGEPIRLNPDLVAGGDVTNFLLSPDGSRVVYRADQEKDELLSLYSVPTDGGKVVRLNDLFGPDRGDVYDFAISADGNWVVYHEHVDGGAPVFYPAPHQGLFSVPIAGGFEISLASAPETAGSYDFQISKDSSRVVFENDLDSPNVRELYTIPIEGNVQREKLNSEPLANGLGDVTSFEISADSSQVVYRADQEVDDVFELYSVPTAGGAPPVKLNASLVSGGNVNRFEISGDSSRVVYMADQEVFEVEELYSVPLTGGPVEKLNGPLVKDGGLLFFVISPNSNRVIYQADQEVDTVYELFSAPINGGAVEKLNAPFDIVANESADVAKYLVSPDSSRVVYRADAEIDNVYELHRVSIAGGEVEILNGPLVTGGTVFDFTIAPDNEHVVYVADQEVDGKTELFASIEPFNHNVFLPVLVTP